MSHCHLAVRHRIRQIEESGERTTADQHTPDWLNEFIQGVAESFEPFSGVARPGFECMRTGDRWEVALFLGKTEMVGGARDGCQLPVNFQFDLSTLSEHFDELKVLRWNAFPDCHVCGEDVIDLSFIIAEGLVKGADVSVQIHAGPPDTAGPALKRFSDGSYVTV